MKSQKNPPLLSETPPFFLSPSDIGVRRNYGRSGSRFAPQAIIYNLKKLNFHPPIELSSESFISVSSQREEELSFNDAQIESAKKIKHEIEDSQSRKFVHLGGGHDHAFPLLYAIDQSNKFENILIFNIDAHCDTRLSEKRHSGTPFRDFDTLCTKPYHLIQYGIHLSNNSDSTLAPLKRGTSKIITQKEISKETAYFSKKLANITQSCPFDISNKTAIFLSLDADALSGEAMKGVSAVNPQGIPPHHIHQLLDFFLNKQKAYLFFGLYEYNPIYDDLSQLGSRILAKYLHHFLCENKVPIQSL